MTSDKETTDTSSDHPHEVEIEEAEVLSPESIEPVAPAAEEFPERPRENRGLALTVFALIAVLAIGAAVYIFQPQPPDNQAEIDQLSAQIAALTELVETPEPEDQAAKAVSELEGALSKELGGLGQTIGALSEQLNDFDNRMQQLETTAQSEPSGEVSTALNGLRGDLKAWQDEVARLEAENAVLRAENEKLSAALTQGQTMIEDLQAKLAETQEAAKTNIDDLTAAAIARISEALSEGRPFADEVAQLANLNGQPIDRDLEAAANGVSTALELQNLFPDAARAALAATLAQNSGGTTLARTGDFLRAQLGLRSVTPREGESPDAVLSRMQFAVDAQDFQSALAEFKNLPESAKAQLNDWTVEAAKRNAALEAIDTLRETSK